MSSSNMEAKDLLHKGIRKSWMPVFRYEIYQGWRSPAWWVLVLNFVLPAFLAFSRPPSPWVLWERSALAPLTLVQVFLIAIPLVLLAAVTRESPRRRRHEMFWLRVPHTGWAYGAKVAAGLMLTVLAAIPVLGYVALTTWGRYGWRGMGPLLLWCLWTLLPLFLVYGALSLGFASLVPNDVLARMLSVAAVIALILLSEQMLPVHLWSPLRGAYFNPVTLFEPFQGLMVWHGAFWAFVALGGILHAVAWMGRKAPRLLSASETRWIRRTHRWAWAFLLLALLPAWHFHREQTLRFDEVPIERITEPWVPSCPQDYAVSLTLDWRNGKIQGKATGRGLATTVRLRQGLEATRIQQGEAWTIVYRGVPRWPRTALWCPECLQNPALNMAVLYQAYPLGWYFVKGALFLTLAGDWHPFPNCPIEHLRVRITPHPCPGDTCIAVAAGARIETRSQTWQAVWSQGARPGPLLAMARTYRVWQEADRNFFLPWPLFPASSQQRLIRFYADALQRMEAVGLSDAGTVRAVAVVPLLRYPRWGNGLLLLPQGLVEARGHPESTDLDYRRTLAAYLLVGWWCREDLHCFRALERRLLSVQQGSPAALEQAYAERQSDSWLTMLDYASLRLVEAEGGLETGIGIGRDLLSPWLKIYRSPLLFEKLDAVYRASPEGFWQIFQAYRETFGQREIPPERAVNWLSTQFPIEP